MERISVHSVIKFRKQTDFPLVYLVLASLVLRLLCILCAGSSDLISAVNVTCNIRRRQTTFHSKEVFIILRNNNSSQIVVIILSLGNDFYS